MFIFSKMLSLNFKMIFTKNAQWSIISAMAVYAWYIYSWLYMYVYRLDEIGVALSPMNTNLSVVRY